MDEPLEYTSMDEWPLRWRFARDAARRTVLPEADMRQFRPLTERCSRVQWHRLVTPTLRHALTAGVSGLKIAEFRTSDDWSAAEKVQRVSEFLRSRIPIQGYTHLLFFWGARCAVDTTWDILLRYWSDFCDSSDDSNVAVPFGGEQIVGHREGHVYVALRKT
jgi:hypothetical protein